MRRAIMTLALIPIAISAAPRRAAADYETGFILCSPRAVPGYGVPEFVDGDYMGYVEPNCGESDDSYYDIFCLLPVDTGYVDHARLRYYNNASDTTVRMLLLECSRSSGYCTTEATTPADSDEDDDTQILDLEFDQIHPSGTSPYYYVVQVQVVDTNCASGDPARLYGLGVYY